MHAAGKRSSITNRFVELTLYAKTSADELIITEIFDLLRLKLAGSISVEVGDKSTQWVADEGEAA